MDVPKIQKTKLFYIGQNISMIRNFIDNNCSEAFIETGINLKMFPFDRYYFNFHEMSKKYYGEQYSDPELRGYATFLTSNCLYKEVIDFDPHIIFLINGDVIDKTALKIFKRFGYKIVIWEVDDPYTIDITALNAPYADFIFTVDSSAVDKYKKSGCKNVYFLPLGFSKKTFSKNIVNEKYQTDMCFIGTPFKGSYRIKILDELSDYLLRFKIRLIGSHVENEKWSSLSNYSRLKESIINELISPDEASNYYNGAKINLNIHRDSYSGSIDKNDEMWAANSPNDRMFNIAGCGAFQIVDNKRKDTGLSFKENDEIVLFNDSEDLKSKISFYLENDTERARIANNAYNRATSDHTINKRIEFIIEKVLLNISK